MEPGYDREKGSAAYLNERSNMSALYPDAWREAPVWKTPRWYHIGDRVRFSGMLLRCGVDHYAGDAANHPWDPGWGWGDGAALLWTVLTPDGMSAEAESAKATAESARERVSGGF